MKPSNILSPNFRINMSCLLSMYFLRLNSVHKRKSIIGTEILNGYVRPFIDQGVFSDSFCNFHQFISFITLKISHFQVGYRYLNPTGEIGHSPQNICCCNFNKYYTAIKDGWNGFSFWLYNRNIIIFLFLAIKRVSRINRKTTIPLLLFVICISAKRQWRFLMTLNILSLKSYRLHTKESKYLWSQCFEILVHSEAVTIFR